jgi:DNA invertase Pin-like site-specific DNA recombinase
MPLVAEIVELELVELQKSNGRIRVKPAVAYLRVSTRNQGISGLGIDAQRAAVESYCQSTGHELIDEFLEIESGARSSRPILREAIDRAKATHSLLVIARLDRLSRSSRFIGELLDGDLRFVACDLPSANRLVMQILAAVAEEEARAASIRTKAALAAAKARGVVLGNPGHLTDEGRSRGGKTTVALRRRERDEALARVARRIRELRVAGAGYKKIAAILNAEHCRTVRGKKWQPMLVWKAVRRMKATI